MVTAKRVTPIPAPEDDVEIRLSAAEARLLAKICWLHTVVGRGVGVLLRAEFDWISYYHDSMKSLSYNLLRQLRSVGFGESSDARPN